MSDESTVHHYFVDEAGDLTLFGRRGKVLVGSPGCSHCFMVGVVHLPDPLAAEEAVSCLRKGLLADPYFKNVPSMQAEQRKTARHFHARDDLPEVRREVFRLLPSLGAKVQVVIRRKSVLVDFAKSLHAAGQPLSANFIYDDMVKRLFRNLLHKADENRIVFARRGKSSRRVALEEAIRKAQHNFTKKWNIPSDKPTQIRAMHPWDCTSLQVVDYYLWALQRFYERDEDRFFELLRPDYRFIMDMDDKRNNAYGEYYSDSNPLDLRKKKAF